MKQLIYGIKYMVNYRFFHRMDPLICGLVLHNSCNLRCRHCDVVNRPAYKMSYGESTGVIDKFYAEGGRCLSLEGGEPMIWRDGKYSMEDLVTYAQKKGFLAVIIYTNGMKPIETMADTVFVSVDGTREIQDELRGISFDRVISNIRNSKHPSIYINFTINSINIDNVRAFLELVEKITQIKGTFFYFHTPYYGLDELYLDSDQKKEMIGNLIRWKSEFSILNSVPGLKSARRNDWKKNLTICKVYENGTYYTCCRENRGGALCEDCGYLSYAEIDQAMKLKPGALLNAIKYF